MPGRVVRRNPRRWFLGHDAQTELTGSMSRCLRRTASRRGRNWGPGLALCSALLPWTSCAAPAPQPVSSSERQADEKTDERSEEDTRQWAVQFGVATISRNPTHKALVGTFEPARGEAEGNIYQFRVTPTLQRFAWKVAGYEFHPEMELPLTLDIVDESGRSPFPAVSAALGFRWTDFPWNRVLYTTAAMAGGLYYASHVPRIDVVRHPDDHRSHWKIYWPIQVTLACPAYPEHQFVLFNDHVSGGSTLDSGGFDSYGLGYRFLFRF